MFAPYHPKGLAVLTGTTWTMVRLSGNQSLTPGSYRLLCALTTTFQKPFLPSSESQSFAP